MPSTSPACKGILQRSKNRMADAGIKSTSPGATIELAGSVTIEFQFALPALARSRAGKTAPTIKRRSGK
jgi:hypothetical protein